MDVVLAALWADIRVPEFVPEMNNFYPVVFNDEQEDAAVYNWGMTKVVEMGGTIRVRWYYQSKGKWKQEEVWHDTAEEGGRRTKKSKKGFLETDVDPDMILQHAVHLTKEKKISRQDMGIILTLFDNWWALNVGT